MVESNEIQEMFAKIFRVSVDSINDETNRDRLRSWDSMRHLELVTALEEAFSIRLSADEIMSLTSFGQVRDLVLEKARR